MTSADDAWAATIVLILNQLEHQREILLATEQLVEKRRRHLADIEGQLRSAIRESGLDQETFLRLGVHKRFLVP